VSNRSALTVGCSYSLLTLRGGRKVGYDGSPLARIQSVHHHKHWLREAQEAVAVIDGSEAPIIDQPVTVPISGQTTGVIHNAIRSLVGFIKTRPGTRPQTLEAAPSLPKVYRKLTERVELQESVHYLSLIRPYEVDIIGAWIRDL